VRHPITDHAALRYLERHYGFDFEKVRKEMLTPIVAAAINAGAQAVKAHGGRMIIKDGRVVSFLPGGRPKPGRATKWDCADQSD
jgi:hypothetical protein